MLRRYKYNDDELAAITQRKLQPSHKIYYYTRDTVKIKNVLRMHNAFPSLTERYDMEWCTADLSEQIRKLRIPIQVVLSNYDEAWPFGSKINPSISQWRKFKAENNVPNLQISEVANARLILTIDKPQVISTILDAFTNGKSVAGHFD